MNILQGYPLNHHHQLRPVNNRTNIVHNPRRQFERATFQPFIIQDEPTELPAQQLHPVTRTIDEHKYLTRERIAPHALLYQLAQAVEALAHIRGLTVKKIMQ